MGELYIVLVGAGGVGKSATTITYVRDVWVSDYDPTIEDSHRKQVTIDGEDSLLHILDTAGQEEYLSMQDQWYRDGEGFLLMYSIASKKSFSEIARKRDRIRKIKDSDTVPMILVGNKSDLENVREVSTEEGANLAAQFGIPFFETSAKNRINIDESFSQLVREIRNKRKEVPKVKKCILF